jgi:purine-binding chemotaxis protein CheW
MQKEEPHLMFVLNKEHFGISVNDVLRVINLERLMKVPMAPDFVAGAISIEGNIIPVVDLAKKIELGATEIHGKTKVIILQIQHDEGSLQVGALIDEVHDVITVTNSKLLPPVLDSLGFNSETLNGVFKSDENFYMILNASKVFEKELLTIAKFESYE